MVLVVAISAPAAGAAPCTPTLSTSKSVLHNGGSVLVIGDTCGSTGRLLAGWRGRWHRLAKVTPGRGGRFTKRVKVRVRKGVHTVRIKSATRAGTSPQVKLTVADRHDAKDSPEALSTAADAKTGSPAQPMAAPAAPEPGPTTPLPVPDSGGGPIQAGEPGSPVGPEVPEVPSGSEGPAEAGASQSTCTLGATSSSAPLPMENPGCRLVASDTAAESDPLAFWSSVQCVSPSRYAYEPAGGDTHPTATGLLQGNVALRKMTVQNGDEYAGSRCELGENDHRYSHTAFYHQGEHLATYFSERLPSNFPLSTNTWQTVMQMKQAQPADGGGGAPILEMEARTDQWVVVDDWHELWTFPAELNTWTRFAWDVYYSQDPSKGWLQVSADLNGDGDFDDPGERSPVFHVATLKTEIEGPNGARDGLVAGEAIPSHLRMGIYHDSSIHCPASGGCSVELDNVQVIRP
jgi:hypothetical protein